MEELEGRVTALESQIRIVRQDGAAARVLAGGADHDVAALTTRVDAQTRLMQALRETQIEHGQRLGGVERRLDSVDHRLDRVDQRLDRVEEKVDRGFSILAAGQAEIVALINRSMAAGEGRSAAE
ncbi:hypothetical protein BJF78_18335 [Pseudonocardia sp. CNS-139]|nr:hypothetical protein BJF78_18335 [Pseudonocardia sp. CNS-139]